MGKKIKTAANEARLPKFEGSSATLLGSAWSSLNNSEGIHLPRSMPYPIPNPRAQVWSGERRVRLANFNWPACPHVAAL